MFTKRLIAGLAATPLVAALAMPLTAFAATTTTVTPLNTQGWSTADTRNTGSITYTNQFNAPNGFGDSALKLDTPDGSDKAQYAHSANNVLLSTVNDISYYAYRSSASTATPGQAPAINLTIDYNGSQPGGFATLVYEPLYQSGGAAAVQNDVWQKWTGDNDSIWWSTRVMPGVTNAFTSYVSLNDIKAANPDATIADFRINQGSGNGGLVSGVDGVTFNGTTYNFEQATTPTDKDKCKNDGWKNFNSPTFKNQGDCVSFVASAKTSNYKLDSNNKDGLNIPTTKGAYYEVTVKGTWTNRPGEVVDAECTNMQSNNWQNAVAGGSYSPDLLDVQVNKAFVDWGPCDSTNHSYTKWVVADDNSMNLRVFDGNTADNSLINDWYNDNNGSLNVTVVAHKI